MSEFSIFGTGRFSVSHPETPHTEHVIVRRPLQRVLAFTGRSIDDIVNSPIAKSQVLGYYKLHCWVDRGIEISDMEKAWNPLGRRT